jgi:hypothetical protein
MNTNKSQAPRLPQNALNPSVLTLEHLAPYLPYKLVIKRKDYIHKNLFLLGIEFNDIIHQIGKTPIIYVKPILRPLSDFYDINAPAFIDTNFDISTQLVLVDLCSKKQHYSGVRYSDMQDFLREHIDVFNLIEQDLAVSIHDVV